MQRKLSPKPTFKPRLECLEGRDLPSAAGIGVFMLSQNIQQGVQAMQSQASQAQSDFGKYGSDLQHGNSSGALSDVAKLSGEIQAVRALNTQIQSELQLFQQSVVAVASDGDSSDQTLAVFSFLQVNGMGGFLGGSNGSSLSSQAQNALSQVNNIATANKVPEPNGQTFTLSETIDSVLTS
ncbi:MAG TPA: hypothetical protein VH592_10715 [Gemmataceae bacterium]|jgi:hypothetical protein